MVQISTTYICLRLLSFFLPTNSLQIFKTTPLRPIRSSLLFRTNDKDKSTESTLKSETEAAATTTNATEGDCGKCSCDADQTKVNDCHEDPSSNGGSPQQHCPWNDPPTRILNTATLNRLRRCPNSHRQPIFGGKR